MTTLTIVIMISMVTVNAYESNVLCTVRECDDDDIVADEDGSVEEGGAHVYDGDDVVCFLRLTIQFGARCLMVSGEV